MEEKKSLIYGCAPWKKTFWQIWLASEISPTERLSPMMRTPKQFHIKSSSFGKSHDQKWKV
jgi:hypothetical protein